MLWWDLVRSKRKKSHYFYIRRIMRNRIDYVLPSIGRKKSWYRGILKFSSFFIDLNKFRKRSSKSGFCSFCIIIQEGFLKIQRFVKNIFWKTQNKKNTNKRKLYFKMCYTYPTHFLKGFEILFKLWMVPACFQRRCCSYKLPQKNKEINKKEKIL